MPRTGILLTQGERAAFAPWLRARVAEARLRKKAIAGKLDDTSTARLNRYLSGENLPTAPVLARLADAIGVPWTTAFLRAGCFRELLGAIDVLADVATDHALAGGWDIRVPTFVVGGPDGRRRRVETVVSGARLRLLVVGLALRAFPRRDVRFPEPIDGDEFDNEPAAEVLNAYIPVTEDGAIAALTSRLHPLLASAADAIGNTNLPAISRRAIAGEYVNAWADAYDAQLATQVREVTRNGLAAVLRLSRPLESR